MLVHVPPATRLSLLAAHHTSCQRTGGTKRRARRERNDGCGGAVSNEGGRRACWRQEGNGQCEVSRRWHLLLWGESTPSGAAFTRSHTHRQSFNKSQWLLSEKRRKRASLKSLYAANTEDEAAVARVVDICCGAYHCALAEVNSCSL